MPENFDTYEALLSQFQVLVAEQSPRIVGVEGYMATGKTYLSRQLGEALSAGRIENDDFAFKLLYPDGLRDAPKDAPYVKCLDLSVLGTMLTAALAEYSLVITEGICLRDVLAGTGRSADVVIYLKSVSRDTGIWHRAIDLENYEAGCEEFRGLHRDELEYHHRVRPHELADLLLTLRDNPPPDFCDLAGRTFRSAGDSPDSRRRADPGPLAHWRVAGHPGGCGGA
jgi:hypothetical protein